MKRTVSVFLFLLAAIVSTFACGGGVAPGTPTPISRASALVRALDEVPFGQIAYNDIKEMTQGKSELVQVYLVQSGSRDIANDLKSKLAANSGTPTIQPIRISAWMTVRLVADPIDFRIVSQHSSERQAVGSLEGTNWSWIVTPLQAGQNKKLYIRATKEAEAGDERGTSELEATVITINVTVDPVYMARQYMWLGLIPVALAGAFALLRRAKSSAAKETRSEPGRTEAGLAPLIRVRRKFGTVAGRVDGADMPELGEMLRRTLIDVEEEYDRVERGAEITGVRSGAPHGQTDPADPQLRPGAEKNARVDSSHSPSEVNTLMPAAPLTFRDFNLRFGSYTETNGVGNYRVWVEGETPGGAMKPDDATARIFDPKAFWDDPATGRGGLLGKVERRNLTRDDLVKLGTLLSDLALPDGAVRKLFDQSLARLNASEGLRVRLHIDAPTLTQLPWEYMLLPRASGPPQDTDFLVLRREVSIVRTDTVESLALPLPKREFVRVVVVLSSPSDQEDLEVEDDKKAIESAVKALNQAGGKDAIKVEWAKRPATAQVLADALDHDTDVFHFAGHAMFDPLANDSKIILERTDGTSDYYGSQQLAQLLRGAGARLVVLGACEMGRRDGKNVWSGVAPALTREKIPAVLANQFKIKDDNAILLASKIYHRVLAGYSADEALFEARQAIYQSGGLEQRDWGVPVLYLQDASGILFPIASEEKRGAADAPFLRVANRFRHISGKVVNAHVREVTGGRIEIESSVDEVTKDGEFTGIEIDKFG